MHYFELNLQNEEEHHLTFASEVSFDLVADLYLRTTPPWRRRACTIVDILRADQRRLYSCLLLAVVVVDVEGAVATVALDSTRVPATLAFVVAFHLHAFLETRRTTRRTATRLFLFRPHEILCYHRLLLSVVVVDIERPVEAHALDHARIPATCRIVAF